MGLLCVHVMSRLPEDFECVDDMLDERDGFSECITNFYQLYYDTDVDVPADSADLQHRNNREEIRRKLAMGSDADDYYDGERTGRKPSLQSRLQSGMNLQICFMNETVNDHETVYNDPDTQTTVNAIESLTTTTTIERNVESVSVSDPVLPLATLETVSKVPVDEATDIISKQAKLQAEARLALAQAKQMAHMQMEVEKQRKKKSPIAEMVGIQFPDGRHKVSRHALSEMNVAQLQVIVNDLHTQIENLNEELVRLLLERDDLHMEQDSMLVDIEDLTRYL